MRKICSKCGTEKELCEFYFRKDRNSYETSCKKCKLENSKKNWKKQLQKNPNYDKERRKNRVKNKPNEIKKYQKERYQKNKFYWAQYRENKIEKIKKYSQYYYQKNKKRLNDYTNDWRKNKNKNDLLFRLMNSSRSALNRFLKGKKNTSFEIIGCTPQELKIHLENKFLDGMNWLNYGKYGWHIDHIIPLSSAKNEEDLYKLFHYTNLQPLWATDNLKKKNKILI